MGLLFKNNAETTLSSGINNSTTTVPVASAAVFPTPDANNVFFATIDDGTNIEVVKVTAISSNDLTVVRAQDNTSASAFSTGAKIELRLTAKVLETGTASLTDLDGDTKIEVEATADSDTIALTSNSGDFSFINSSNTIALVKTDNNDFTIQNNLNDKDFKLKGYDADGGGLITGLTIDYSDAGRALFNGSIDIGGSNISRTGDLTLDVSGDITIDADGEHIRFKDGGTEIGHVDMGSQNFTLRSKVSDKDIIFRGNDGGTDFSALTLDMSEAGTASFNHDIQMVDNGLLRMGAGGDLILSSDGTNGTINTNNGAFTVDSAGDIILDADSTTISLRDGGTENSQIGLDSAGLVFTVVGADKDFFISGNDGGSAITGVRVDFSDAGAIICNGNITAFGNTSDIKLKENIEVIPNALDKVKQLKGITFNYKKDGRVSTGLIAQDLEKVLPEVVYEVSDIDNDEEKHLAVRYGNTVGLLVEAIKELSAKIEKLEGK